MRTCWLTVVFISRRSILSSTTECSFANQDESSEMSRPWYSRRQPEVRVRVRVRVRTRVLASVVRVRERVRLEAHLRVGVAVALPQQLPLCGRGLKHQRIGAPLPPLLRQLLTLVEVEERQPRDQHPRQRRARSLLTVEQAFRQLGDFHLRPVCVRCRGWGTAEEEGGAWCNVSLW